MPLHTVQSGTQTRGGCPACRYQLPQGRLGALSVGRSEDLAEARRMLAEGVDVSGAREALADAESDLASIS